MLSVSAVVAAERLAAGVACLGVTHGSADIGPAGHVCIDVAAGYGQASIAIAVSTTYQATDLVIVTRYGDRAALFAHAIASKTDLA